jgi:aspartate-semialdehyde dehydrogenase
MQKSFYSAQLHGTRAMYQLWRESRELLKRWKTEGGRWKVEGEPWKLATRHSPLITPLPKQIAFNVIPQVDVFLKNESTREEMKMVHETRKILEEPTLPISASCVRVPVFVAHSEAVWIETERPLSPGKARELLRHAPGVRLLDEPAAGAYPLPIHAAGRDEVFVGRVRKDESVEHGLALWVSGDNLRKGAATNAIQIAELLVTRKL